MRSHIHIYNTLTKRIEPFTPLEQGKVNLFVCGPTVYDYSHLGHGKTYTQFDFIARYLRHRGFEVFYLQNITDIDDKIIQRAQERQQSWQELARAYEQSYHEDMAALHNTAVTRHARATDYIHQIVAQVQTLMKKGFAYQAADGIYYEVARFKDYGKLSGRTEVKADDAVSRIDDSAHKRGWNDFALWKFAKPGEPSWDTPLGAGRPGWHIEDTAITEAFFGPQYDIHGGAIDLIFPHHEAEIAQIEAASGREPMVQIWMHGGFLNIGRQKMSKSLNNFTTIRSVLSQYGYRTLRYLFLSTHYRSALSMTADTLEQAEASIGRLDEFVFSLNPDFDDAQAAPAAEALRQAVYQALDHDFNTPAALAALHEFIRKQNAAATPGGRRVWSVLQDLNSFLEILNLEPFTEDQAEQINQLIRQRDDYRAQKDFTRADDIRAQLAALNIKVYDTAEGTKWRRL